MVTIDLKSGFIQLMNTMQENGKVFIPEVLLI